jgi:hypothetical protein
MQGNGQSAWDNHQLHRLLQSRPDWKDVLARACEKDLAGEALVFSTVIGSDTCAACAICTGSGVVIKLVQDGTLGTVHSNSRGAQHAVSKLLFAALLTVSGTAVSL